MIIDWKGDGVLVVPCLGGGGQTVDQIDLQPGKNEVDAKNWAVARKNCLNKIRSAKNPDGKLIENINATIEEKEIEVDVPVINPETKEPKVDPETKEPVTEKKKEKKTEITVKEFEKLEPEVASNIIADCYDIKALEIWLKDEPRDSVRANIQNQIDFIKTAHEDRRKKKKEEKDK